MDETLIIKYCSPTLASLKSASLFTYLTDNLNEADILVNDWNLLLNKKGIFIEKIFQKNTNALIYVYRPDMLMKEINEMESKQMLEKLGYKTDDLKSSIGNLKERIANSSGFPHEIGLFLGYPYEDVIGFIKNSGKNQLCNGLWKVYKNEEKKKKMFNTCTKLKQSYKILYANGRKIENLCV